MSCCTLDLAVQFPGSDEIMKEYVCPICLQLMAHPVLLECKKHYLGQTCAETFFLKNNKHQCPECKIDILPVYTSGYKLKKIIDCFIRKCEHNECKITFKHGDLDKHLLSCEFHKNPCKFCKTFVLQSTMDKHVAECEHRILICDDCKLTYVFKDKNIHDGLCLDKLLPCVCKIDIKRKDMATHKAIVCPEELVLCKYCPNIKVLRKDLETHNNTDMAVHIKILEEQLEKKQEIKTVQTQCIERYWKGMTFWNFNLDGNNTLRMRLETNISTPVVFILELWDNSYKFSCVDDRYKYVVVKGNMILTWANDDNDTYTYNYSMEDVFGVDYASRHIDYDNDEISIKPNGTLKIEFEDMYVSARLKN
jgi:hypothetical protein